MYYREVRVSKVRTSPPKLVTVDEVKNYIGYTSVYGYNRQTAARIERERSTAKIRDGVYSDCLYVDIDRSDWPSRFLSFLDSEGLGYEVYFSGRKGYHFHIKFSPTVADWLPSAQKSWVKANCPEADTSIYHPAAIIRLPKTYHEDNPGYCKCLIAERQGGSLSLSAPTSCPDNSTSSLRPKYNNLYEAILYRKEEGQRRPHMFILACLAIERGYSLVQTINVCLWWNKQRSCPSHDEHTVTRFVEDVWRRKCAG